MSFRGHRLSRLALLCGAVLGLGLPEGAAQVANHLSNARPEEWHPGQPPLRPWQYSEDGDAKVVLAELDNHDAWVELKIATPGALRIGSGGQHETTPVAFTPGATERLYVDFRTVNGDLHLVLGRLGVPDGTPPLFETTLPQQGRSVSRLRLATDNAPRGGHVFVADLVLTPAGKNRLPNCQTHLYPLFDKH